MELNGFFSLKLMNVNRQCYIFQVQYASTEHVKYSLIKLCLNGFQTLGTPNDFFELLINCR
jgi:hypothetical protein